MTTDRNLLVGIVAVQMNFVSRDDLITAMNAWLLEKHRPLAELLPLPTDRRALLEALVSEHLKLHDGDAQKSLAALSSASSVEQLVKDRINDADVQASLGWIGTGTIPQLSAPSSQDASQRFRILRPHAKGGLGEVFVAEDREIRRHVALKEIQRKHADDLNSRSRFVLEAEVTGGLEHPNIVPVYGLGTYADGRPFYAMRFIRGDSLKEAIERYHSSNAQSDSDRNLVFRNLLKRFVDVCNAVAYAHSRGILHRDLKPGNIMLGKYGETLVVDWGLAKSLTNREPEVASDEPRLQMSGGYDETIDGSAVGTPPFMSPEQAAGRLDQIGPASDIYSLGAMLYVILTGRVAFDGTVGEILRKVEAGDFAPPNAVRADVPAALNAIVLKAMRKTPSERYTTATQLAEEIEHFLADEPVNAYAEPRSQRLKRWARKHPGPVAGLSAALAVGLIGSAIAAMIVGGKNRELAESNTSLAAARDIANERSEEAKQRYQLAMTAFDNMVFTSQNRLERLPGTLEIRKELLENARAGLNKLVQGAPDRTLAYAYYRIGDVSLNLGSTEDASREYEAGTAMARRIFEAEPDNPDGPRDVSVGLDKLGDVALLRGQTSLALDYFTKSMALAQRLADAYPAIVQHQRDLSIGWAKLGDIQMQLGRIDEAHASYEKSLAVDQRRADAAPGNIEARRDLGISLIKLGDVLRRRDKSGDAVVHYRKSLALAQAVAGTETGNGEFQRDVGIAYEKLGNAQQDLDQHAAGRDSFQASYAIRERLAAADPKNTVMQRDLNIILVRLGDASLKLEQPEKAQEFYQQSLAIAQRLAAADPKNVDAQRAVAIGFNKLGHLDLHLGRSPEAVKHFQQSLAVIQQLEDADPASARARQDLFITLQSLGDAHFTMEQYPEALAWYRKSRDLSSSSFKPDLTYVEKQIEICEKAIKLRETAPLPQRK